MILQAPASVLRVQPVPSCVQGIELAQSASEPGPQDAAPSTPNSVQYPKSVQPEELRQSASDPCTQSPFENVHSPREAHASELRQSASEPGKQTSSSAESVHAPYSAHPSELWQSASEAGTQQSVGKPPGPRQSHTCSPVYGSLSNAQTHEARHAHRPYAWQGPPRHSATKPSEGHVPSSRHPCATRTTTTPQPIQPFMLGPFPIEHSSVESLRGCGLRAWHKRRRALIYAVWGRALAARRNSSRSG